jgi:hypothetical protein
MLRRKQFGPCPSTGTGFTRPIGGEGQLPLVVLPLPAHELRILLTTPLRSGLRPLPDYYALC